MEVRLVVLPKDMRSIPEEDYQRCLQEIDTPGQTRVKRYFRREDAWRSLVGMLLPRRILVNLGIPLKDMLFGKTDNGKPYVDCPPTFEAFGYNVSHDNLLVGMVSQSGKLPDVRRIGIDVMKRSLPQNETYASFLRGINDTLTPSELALFEPQMNSQKAVKYIFQLWTFKEAFTKALGLGLGFDFKRIEFHIPTSRVLVDGTPPKGWEFLLFELKDGEEIYDGTVAKWVGGEETQITTVSNIGEDNRFHVCKMEDVINEKI